VTETRVITVDNVARSYVVHEPDEGGESLPLVISCHGGGSNGVDWWTRHWKRHADQGLKIVCPTSECERHGTNWVALGDEDYGVDVHLDEGFITELRAVEMSGDTSYLCGFSSGAKMTHHMMAFSPALFDGYAVAGHGISEEMVDEGQLVAPARLRIAYGTKDPNYANPSAGLLDATGTLEYYLRLQSLNGLAPNRDTIEGSKTTAKQRVWDGGGFELEYAAIYGMPHRYAKVRLGDPYYETSRILAYWGIS